jgi:hypothetical protein
MQIRILSKTLALVTATIVLFSFAPPVQALPTFGGGHANCTTCHGNQREAATTPLTITAMPGDLIPLTLNVTNGADSYSASIAGLNAAGLAGFTPDPTWANHFTAGTFNPDPQFGGPFFALSNSGINFSGAVTQTFNLQLAASTAPGTYPLTFTGGGSGTEGLWRDSNPFELTVIPEPSTLVLTSIGLILGRILWRRRHRRLQ